MKKLIAVLLAALMCLSVLAACGGSDGKESTATKASESQAETTKEGESASQAETSGNPEETYQAKFILYVANDNWPHMANVVEAVKELTKKELNIEATALPYTFGGAASQVPLMLAANEPLDIINQQTPVDYYEQGYIIDMAPYEQYLQGTINDVFGKDEVEASKRNGMLLGFFPRMERTHRYGMAMRTDILKEVGFDPETINGDIEEAFDKATEIFKAVHDKYPDMNVMGGTYNSNPACNQQHTDSLTDGYGVLDNYGDNFDVINFFESDYFKKAAEYAKKWHDAGYIQKDMPTNQSDGYETLVRAGNTFGGCCPMKPDSYAEKRDQCNHDMTIFYWREDMITAYNGSGYSIAGTSRDPVQAARLMEFMFTNRDFNDLVNWGVKGEDWVENPDEPNQAMYPEGMTAENQTYHNSFGWIYPNQRIAHVWVNNEPDMYTRIYPDAEKDSHKTKAYGFIFDNTEYLDQIGALNNIRDEYWYVIGAGAAKDYEASIQTMNEKMYDSGLQTLMDAKQEALDKWCEEHGISK